MAEDSRKLFVAGLPDSISDVVLRQLFEATGGTVVDVNLPKDRATGRPRGFGFVTLATSEEAHAARQELDGSIQGGKSISVRPFQNEPPRRDVRGAGGGGMDRAGGGMDRGGGGGMDRGGGGMDRGGGGGGMDRGGGGGMDRGGGGGMDRGGGGGGMDRGAPAGAGAAAAMGGPQGAPDRTMYVGNLPYDASVEEVESLINATGAGPVVRVHLPMDPDGRKRGFGFVTMASADAARIAIEALRGMDVRGRRLVVNLAHPKGEKPARDERGFGGGGGYSDSYRGGGGGDGYRGDSHRPEGGAGGGPGPGPGGGAFRGDNFRPYSPAPPPAPRRTFDERRRRGGGDGEGPPGGGGRRNRNWERDRDDDWDE